MVLSYPPDCVSVYRIVCILYTAALWAVSRKTNMENHQQNRSDKKYVTISADYMCAGCLGTAQRDRGHWNMLATMSTIKSNIM